MKNLFIFFIFFIFYCNLALSQENKSQPKTKFYNFDDLLINGEYRKPQVLYTDARQKVRFERLLKLKKDFMPKLKSTQKDPSLR
jgi:hypothetical protein